MSADLLIARFNPFVLILAILLVEFTFRFQAISR